MYEVDCKPDVFSIQAPWPCRRSTCSSSHYTTTCCATLTSSGSSPRVRQTYLTSDQCYMWYHHKHKGKKKWSSVSQAPAHTFFHPRLKLFIQIIVPIISSNLIYIFFNLTQIFVCLQCVQKRYFKDVGDTLNQYHPDTSWLLYIVFMP